VLGRIAAGTPLLAASTSRTTSRSRWATGGTGHFALHVVGDSMIEAGILDGDVVVVRSQDRCDDGDVVAVLLPGRPRTRPRSSASDADGERRDARSENPLLQPFEMHPQAASSARWWPSFGSSRLRPRQTHGRVRAHVRHDATATALERAIRSQPDELGRLLGTPIRMRRSSASSSASHLDRGTGTSQHAAELGAAMLHDAGRAAYAGSRRCGS